MDFIKFKNAVAIQFNRMASKPMFRTAVSGNDLWDVYLKSFPEGSNPIYKTKTEHDCNCCKQFIRAIGNVVNIVDGQLVSIWDIQDEVGPEYSVVAAALAAEVKLQIVCDVFLSPEHTAGTHQSFQDIATGGVQTWNHFFVNIPGASVVWGLGIPTRLGTARSRHEVFHRAFTTIKKDAVDTVLELISQNSLYRGGDHKATLQSFRKLIDHIDSNVGSPELWHRTWAVMCTIPDSVAFIRNTSIGTLLVALSEGEELDVAVGKFEAMVAPANYKRPTALVTPKMIEAAKKTIEELGLTSALQRRYATLEDITVNNSIFVNRSTRAKLEKDVFDTLQTKATPVRTTSKLEEITIEDFISNVVPKVDSIEVLFENRHQPNLVSLLTACEPTARKLFKWDNPFSWSYNGDVTDSIKERVKAAGGNVSGDLCCRLAWHNTDDLDLHMTEPGGDHIYYGCRRRLSLCGGMLDLDANGADGMRNDPAENIFYADKRKMREGEYHLYVKQFMQRKTTDVGFEAEIEFMGEIHRFSYPQVVKGNVTIARFRYTHAKGIEFINSLPSTTASKKVWNLDTQTFHPVNVLMLSPNYWSDCIEEEAQGIGNKHYFFLLDQCRNEETARGMYNEFLRNDLNQHRKVLETVGSKLRSDEQAYQLSGLGFSSTMRNELTVKVSGAFTRQLLVKF